MWKLDGIRVPDFACVVLVDEVFEVEFESFLIRWRLGYSFGDLDDYGAEA